MAARFSVKVPARTHRLPSARTGRNRDCTTTPTINELEALVDCATHSPALPSGHPFADVRDIYRSSTTSLFEPDWAWALYMEKGATGIGQKRFAQFSVWAVATVD
jgi:Protein of unknown function (DUF1566)